MYLATNFQGNQPITWWGRVPVYLTTIITAVFTAALVAQAVLMAARVDLTGLAFAPQAFLHGAVWQPLTYAFLGQLSFFTPLGLLCLYQWGVEVERYLGRPRFLALFAQLLAVPLVVGLGWYTALGAGGAMMIAGNYPLLAGLLIAFATLYPGIEYLGWVPLKWFAFVCVVAGSLMDLADRNYLALTILLGNCAAAWAYIRWLQVGGEVRWPAWQAWLRRKRLRVLPDPEPRPAAGRADADVDAILDKISRSGMASLTAAEREQLHQRSRRHPQR
jgi:hypothetical protein